LDFCSREQVERPAEPSRQDLFVSRLGPGRLYELAGEDMRFCLDMTGRRPAELRELDFVTAAIQLLPALGVSGPAWRDAVDTIGDFRAALCVLVTDANRD
jgi:replication initiation protein RepC